MNSEMIDTFLAVAETGNITEAANRLFIGQGTASARIRALEEELGIVLFERGRGIKNVQITPEGECFRTLARQWLSLEQQSHEIKSLMSYRELRIAASDSINSYTFAELYLAFARENPRARLYLQTEHSSEVHQLIEDRSIDIGFATTLHRHRDVLSRPLFRERWVVVCDRDCPYVESHDPADLFDVPEVYSTVSSDFAIWHDRHFSPNGARYASIGTLSMLAQFMSNKGLWALAPSSVATHLCWTYPRLVIVDFDHDAPPDRITYLLYHRQPRPWIDELTDTFIGYVERLVAQSDALEPAE